jgi:hypothetical protein
MSETRSIGSESVRSPRREHRLFRLGATHELFVSSLLVCSAFRDLPIFGGGAGAQLGHLTLERVSLQAEVGVVFLERLKLHLGCPLLGVRARPGSGRPLRIAEARAAASRRTHLALVFPVVFRLIGTPDQKRKAFALATRARIVFEGICLLGLGSGPSLFSHESVTSDAGASVRGTPTSLLSRATTAT